MAIRYVETYWLQYNLINIIDITCVREKKSKSSNNVNSLAVQYLICSFLFSAKNWPSLQYVPDWIIPGEVIGVLYSDQYFSVLPTEETSHFNCFTFSHNQHRCAIGRQCSETGNWKHHPCAQSKGCSLMPSSIYPISTELNPAVLFSAPSSQL